MRGSDEYSNVISEVGLDGNGMAGPEFIAGFGVFVVIETSFSLVHRHWARVQGAHLLSADRPWVFAVAATGSARACSGK